MKSLTTYIPTILSLLLALLHWVNTDLSLAIAQADKSNNGSLENIQLEDVAVNLIKDSNNIVVKSIPIFIVRYLIRSLCAHRNNVFNIKETTS